VIARTIPDAFKAFGPELEITAEEAEVLLVAEPNKEKNIEQIKKNRDAMNKSPLPKPALVTTMFSAYENNPDQSPWFW